MSARDDELQPDLLGEALAAEPVRPHAELRTKVLGSIASGSRFAGFLDRLATFFDLAQERAGELIREASGDARSWEVMPVAGVRLFHLSGGPRIAAADCGLVRIEPGARFPRHRHRGDEWSFVLAGEAVEEGTGARWAPGDLVHRPADSAHAFRSVGSEPLLFAVVLHGGLELDEG